jgi:hypothetical protein
MELQHVPGLFENVITSDTADMTIRFFTPAPTVCGVDISMYATVGSV